jgi:hypothetical protein
MDRWQERSLLRTSGGDFELGSSLIHRIIPATDQARRRSHHPPICSDEILGIRRVSGGSADVVRCMAIWAPSPWAAKTWRRAGCRGRRPRCRYAFIRVGPGARRRPVTTRLALRRVEVHDLYGDLLEQSRSADGLAAK